jgi:hypothetical protein
MSGYILISKNKDFVNWLGRNIRTSFEEKIVIKKSHSAKAEWDFNFIIIAVINLLSQIICVPILFEILR